MLSTIPRLELVLCRIDMVSFPENFDSCFLLRFLFRICLVFLLRNILRIFLFFPHHNFLRNLPRNILRVLHLLLAHLLL